MAEDKQNLKPPRPIDIHLYGGTAMCGRNAEGKLAPIYGKYDLLYSILMGERERNRLEDGAFYSPKEEHRPLIAVLDRVKGELSPFTLADNSYVEERFRLNEAIEKTSEGSASDLRTAEAALESFTLNKHLQLFKEAGAEGIETVEELKQYYQDFQEKLGIRIVEHPLTDSAVFQTEAHYEPMLDDLTKSYEQGRDAMVVWGTTSTHFYAPLLTYGLQKRGYLQPQSEERLAFCGSLHAMQDLPQMNDRFLQAHRKSQQKEANEYSQVVFLHAEDDEYQKLQTQAGEKDFFDAANNISRYFPLEENFIKLSEDVQASFAQDYRTSIRRLWQEGGYPLMPFDMAENAEEKLVPVMFPLCHGTPPENVNKILNIFANCESEQLPACLITEVVPETEEERRKFLTIARKLKVKGCQLVCVMDGVSQAKLKNLNPHECREHYVNSEYNWLMVLKTLDGPTREKSFSSFDRALAKSDPIIAESGSTPHIVAKAMQGWYGTKRPSRPLEIPANIAASEQLSTAVFGFVPSEASCEFFKRLQEPYIARPIVASYEQDFIPDYLQPDAKTVIMHGNFAKLSFTGFLGLLRAGERAETLTEKVTQDYAVGGSSRGVQTSYLTSADYARVLHEGMKQKLDPDARKIRREFLSEKNPLDLSETTIDIFQKIQQSENGARLFERYVASISAINDLYRSDYISALAGVDQKLQELDDFVLDSLEAYKSYLTHDLTAEFATSLRESQPALAFENFNEQQAFAEDMMTLISAERTKLEEIQQSKAERMQRKQSR